MDQTTRDLADALMMLARQSTTASNNIRNASQILAEYKDPMERSKKAYEQHVRKMQASYSDEGKARVQVLTDLKRHHELTNQELNAKRQEIATLKNDIAEKQKAIRRQQNLAKKNEKAFGQLDDATLAAKEGVTALKKQLGDMRQSLKTTTEQEQRRTQHLNRLNQVIQMRTNDLKNLDFKEAKIAAGSALKKGLAGVFNKFMQSFSAMDTVKRVYGQTTAEISTGVNVASSFGDYHKLAKLGLSGEDAVKMMKESRRSVLAAGGKEETLQMIEQTKQTMKGFMNLEDVATYTAGQMDLLTNSGIKPTMNTIGALRESFISLRKNAGMIPAEFNAAVSDIASDDGMQAALRGASETERVQILKSIAARIAEHRAMGMSIEQSKELIKQQTRLSTANPLARLTQGIRMQALGGALGVGGGAEFSRISRIAESKRSEADKAFYQQYLSQISKTTADMAQADSFSIQVLGHQLSEALDPEKIAGPMSVFNTSLTEVAKVQTKAADSLGEVSNTLKLLVEYFQTGKSVIQNNPYATFGAAVLGGAAVRPLARMAVSGGKALLGRGAPAAASSGGIINSAKTLAMKHGSKALGSAAKFGGRALPVVGTAAGSVDDIMEGNYGRAAAGMTGGALLTGAGLMLAPVTGGASILVAAGLGMAGNYIGGKLYDKATGEEGDSTQPVMEVDVNKVNETAEAQEEHLAASAEHLKTLNDTTKQLVAISERQLEVMQSDRGGSQSRRTAWGVFGGGASYHTLR